MIRVLIVEDDKFARQGMIQSLPWEKHRMVVVGEASNGKAALEILAKDRVDLVLCDYSMPGMNGLELLTAIREKYPEVAVGMITLYESFDIIQQAMRIGAIDYISKLQLEEENYDQVLETLEKKVSEQRQIRRKATPVMVCPQDVCYLFSCINNQAVDVLNERYSDLFLEHPVEIGLNIYACYQSGVAEGKDVLNIIAHPWYALRITGLTQYEQDKFYCLVRRYYRYHMFYYHKSKTICIAELERIVNSIPSVQEDSVERLQSVWMASEWLYDDAVFKRQLLALRECMLPFNVLFKLLVKIEDAVSRKYGDVFSDVKPDLPYNLFSWEEVSGWLTNMHDRMQRSVRARKLSDEVMRCVTKALQIIYDEIDSPLLVNEVAGRVNMSRSYFSSCFKKVTGVAFNQYVRKKRILIAKEYLESTDYPVTDIAAKCGYEDEKYFGKVFRQETGMLPTRYRKERKKSVSQDV